MSDGSQGPLTGAGGGAPSTGDWPAQAADTIVKVVGQVRDKTTGPAITVARAIVYGLLAAILGGTCLVLLAIAGVRVLNVWLLPDAWFGEVHTWAAHLVLGVIFTGVGAWCWSKRRAADAE